MDDLMDFAAPVSHEQRVEEWAQADALLAASEAPERASGLILAARAFEAAESGTAPPGAPMARTLNDANRASRRLRTLYSMREEHEQTLAMRIAELDEQKQAVKDAYQAEIDSIDGQVAEEHNYIWPWLAHRILSDPRRKRTVHLEGCAVGVKDQVPVVTVEKGKEAEVAAFLAEHAPDCLNYPPPKIAMIPMRALPVRYGKYHAKTGDGELVPVPHVSVHERKDQMWSKP